jgi:hypothetical protein
MARANLSRIFLRRRYCGWVSLFALLALPVLGQLPPSGPLSPSDRQGLGAEIKLIDKMLSASPANCWIMNEMARTWAAGRQYPETLAWLTRIANLGVGLDPSRDPLYRNLRGTREFAAVLRKTREATGPVSHSREAFRISEGDLVPESEAYDPAGRRFYFGSMSKGVVVGCNATGDCTRFADRLGSVLGLKTDEGRLWVVAHSGGESALVELALNTGRQVRKYIVPGAGHSLNDISVGSNGDVFATDTPGASIWRLRRGADRLEPFLPGAKFQFANGIAVAAGGTLLYVSNYPDGITVVDLATGSVRPIKRPPGLCLALIDGLYTHGRSLVAIQNGSMTPRVAQFHLSEDSRGIDHFEVLERGNPLFEGITGGTIAGGDFYYAANIQDEKQPGAVFNPIIVLKAPLPY